MPSAFGGLGCNPRYKRYKEIADSLWSDSAKRIFVTPSVSRNARFRGVRGEKDFCSGICLFRFLDVNAALLFY